ADPRAVTIVRIAETLQVDEAMMGALLTIGAIPGNEVDVREEAGTVVVSRPDGAVELSRAQAKQVFVRAG
ncbi:MAG: FeoA domain-containing protein, partial [Actinomycetota bacterium]|nr:FeoA domain-containing protein [Actinomycetota bacterium]